MRVIINAQLRPGVAGGIEQFVTGLIHGLGRLTDGPEEYLIIGPWQDPEWLAPYLGPNQRIIPGRRSSSRLTTRGAVKAMLGPLRTPAVGLWRRLRGAMSANGERNPAGAPLSDGFLESLGGHVVHFPFQTFVRCGLPSVFNPHDLQHLYYPQYFTKGQLAWRRRIYPDGCRLAQAIAAESGWVKEDITKHFGISPTKIYVVHRGAPTDLCEPVTPQVMKEVQRRYDLPATFALFPAQTWAHKNHLRLLDAVRLLADQKGQKIHVMCTGRQNEFWPVIERHLKALQLERQVRFLGHVPHSEVRALYRLAQFVILPSLFEGGGFPVVEAFREGTPVACSEITSLPEYAGDAALFFDPHSTKSIAEAMLRMATDEGLREALRDRGRARAGLFTWERTALAYRALYRTLADVPISEEERELLRSDPSHVRSPGADRPSPSGPEPERISDRGG